MPAPRSILRTQFLFSLVVVCFAFFAQCVFAGDSWSRDDAAHLLRRAGFGGTPHEIDRLHALGKSAAVEYLLTGALSEDEKSDPLFCDATLTDYNPLPALANKGKPPAANRKAEIAEMRAWWIDRMVRTNRPLEEKMTLFWHGILTSGAKEVASAPFMMEQNDLFRRQGMGNYKALALDLIHDPAMLKYLNNDQNMKGKANENLARELMELFTMGEGNGYTEKDISEVARALTGATIGAGGYQFQSTKHDDGEKIIFGQTGKYKPDDVVDLIFETQKPARYLAKRLWANFVSADPSDKDIDAIADTLLKNDWEIKPALRVMFTCEKFYSPDVRFCLVKSPTELLVGTMRQLEITPAMPMMTGGLQAMQHLGQELFQPPNVRGWPGGESWITSATLYVRYNLCSELIEGNLKPGNFDVKPKPPAKPATKPAAKPTALPTTMPNRITPLTQPATKPEKISALTDENFIALAFAPSTQPVTQPAKAQATTKPAVAKTAATKPATTNPAVAAAPTTRPMQYLLPTTKPIAAPALTSKLPARESQPAMPLRIFSTMTNPTPEQIVDAAIDRFVQRSLAAKKREALLDAIGNEPLQLSDKDSDARVRHMLSLLLNTPEYQLE